MLTQMRAGGLLALVLLAGGVFLVGGCGPEDPPPPMEMEDVPEPVEPAPDPEPEPEPAPEPDPEEEPEAESDLIGQELLRNASFDDAQNGRFSPWWVSRWGETTDDLSPELIEDDERGTVVAYPLPEDGGVALVQIVYDVDEGVRGRQITAEATGVAHAEGELAFQIRYEINGEEHTMTPTHSGSGEWETWSTQVDLPTDAHPEQIRFQVFRRVVDEPSEEDVLIDSVAMRID